MASDGEGLARCWSRPGEGRIGFCYAIHETETRGRQERRGFHRRSVLDLYFGRHTPRTAKIEILGIAIEPSTTYQLIVFNSTSSPQAARQTPLTLCLREDEVKHTQETSQKATQAQDHIVYARLHVHKQKEKCG